MAGGSGGMAWDGRAGTERSALSRPVGGAELAQGLRAQRAAGEVILELEGESQLGHKFGSC